VRVMRGDTKIALPLITAFRPFSLRHSNCFTQLLGTNGRLPIVGFTGLEDFIDETYRKPRDG